MATNAADAAGAAAAGAADAAAAAAGAPPPMPMFMLTDLLSYANPVFRNYCFWTAILVIKMLIMSIITLIQRFRTGTWGNNAEDTKDGDVFAPNKYVERVRRAHRNDLENIIPFILISFCYTLCVPWPAVACWLFRIAGIARILHTCFSVIYEVPQPSRSICWLICFLITIWMAVWPLLVFIA